MIAKIVEMFKVTDTIETIIEMVDAVEKSPEYTMMDTELTAIRSPKTKKRAKVTGDPDAIIKQLVDMATTETTGGKKKAKVEGDEKKAPRGKKAAKPPSTDAPAATDAPTTDVETEPKKKAPRAKKAAKADDSKVDDSKAPEAPITEAEAEAKPTTDVVTEPKKKAPRAKKVAEPKAITIEEAPPAPTKAAAEPTTAPKAPKKASAKKTKTTVESNGNTPNGTTPNGNTPNGNTPNGNTPNGTTPESTEPAKPKTKAPKAPKAPSNIVHPNEVVEVAEDLREDEYMLLNEVEVDGKTYMVDSSQNVYNEFNDVIGKYENGVVTMNA